jgi:hypothetical protein
MFSDPKSERLSSPGEPIPGWLACLLLLSITFALYSPSLYFEFVWDDAAYIRENYRIHALDLLHLRSFWTGTYLGHYAPFHHLFLALVYAVEGNAPFPFHVANLAIHMRRPSGMPALRGPSYPSGDSRVDIGVEEHSVVSTPARLNLVLLAIPGNFACVAAGSLRGTLRSFRPH